MEHASSISAATPPQTSAATEAIDVSVIVPAMNEAENFPELLRRIDAALTGMQYEVLIVDDNSKDRTPEVCAELATKYPLTLLVRIKPTNGLSGAVLHGMAEARGRILCVMDADLQHPPERLPALMEPLKTGDADFVIGSRYMPGGSTEAEWGIFRKLNSKVATALAGPFAGNTTDPMAGFFALRRETYKNAKQLTPLGYKIALELMCKCRVKNAREIPIHFSTRLKGESKLSLKQQFRYLEHLSRLYDFKFPHASPVAKFLIATALGWFACLAMYVILLHGNASRVTALAISYPAAILMTALLHLRYVSAQREFIVRPKPWRDFALISAAEWATCIFAAWWVGRRVDHPGTFETFVLSVGAATLVRYVLRKEFMQDIRGLRKSLPREIEAMP
jgi:dolichol-phosphate mannosyltransferase